MDDITGKKFSLQDWVTRRAANQSGAGTASGASSIEAIQPLSIKKAVNGDTPMASQEEPVEQLDQVTSSVQVDTNVSEPDKGNDRGSGKENKMEKESVSKPYASDVLGKVSERVSDRSNPVQQLQIVRLLSDLGERLRQSEKEREILWKEIEACRKQISDMNSKNNESEKTVHALEGQIGQKEDFIKGLLDKQAELEDLIKGHTTAIETDKSERQKLEEKLQEKLVGIETTTGSAIVRIEDAIAENTKLSKRIEQLSQDKARLSRKLEVMEETLTQTQETLKAKALVLLTDQAMAAKTQLPQSPAWTGDDTLRVSSQAQNVQNQTPDVGPVADIAASVRSKKQGKASDMNNTAFLAALVVLGIAGGVLLGQVNFRSSSSDVSVPSIEQTATSSDEEMLEPSAGEDTQAADPSQEELMADIATLANKIEPAVADDAVDAKDDTSVSTVLHDGFEPSEFDKAIEAEDKALDAFNADKLAGDVSSRIKADKSLPKAVKEIEAKAFQGDAAAQHDLAAVYTAGHAGVKVNYERAVQWFTEAAHQNVSNAQYNLGVLYHQGLGVSKDVEKAINLYRVAAANGHPEAQYNLAIAYIEGVGAEYNPQIAAVYFQKSASGGIVEAAYNLGLLHENGLLGESQPDEAVFWYSLAANKGNEQAKTALQTLKAQLSMSDDDAERIISRIAETKPGFTNEDGQPMLPDPLSPGMEEIEPASGELRSALDVDDKVVSQIQDQLKKAGLFEGASNGQISNDLRDAIKSYQQKNGLSPDGAPSETLLVHILANQAGFSSGL